MKRWVLALILATISGLSLPIGAILGIVFTPVRDEVCAAWMALGAGALLFAVTVEIYGHTLRELELGRAGLLELFATVGGALVGAIFYLSVNRQLEKMMEVPMDEDEEQKIQSLPESPTEQTPLYRRSVSGSLAEERRKWEQVSSPQAAGGPSLRDESFSRLSHASADSGDQSIRSRGRDKVINNSMRLSIGSGMSSRPRTPKSAESKLPEPTPEAQPETLMQVDPKMAERGKAVAFALFLGILVDGVPEGILMGFLAAEGHLSVVLVISLIIANFPEAFSSASLMRHGGVPRVKIVGMWGGLCIMVGALAGGSCFLLTYFFPTYPGGENLPQGLLLMVAVVEGLTGGAMIACIAAVMLPEAFNRAGKEGTLFASSGFLCTAGFLVAVTLKALEHHYNNTHGHTPEVYGHSFFFPGYGYW